MKYDQLIRRALPILAGMALLFFVAPAGAEGYLAAKDTKNIEALERALKGIEGDPQFWDGKQIPAGADLNAMSKHLDKLSNASSTFSNYYNRLSDDGKKRPRTKVLIAQIQRIGAYYKAAQPVFNAAVKLHNTANAKKRAETARIAATSAAQCKKLKGELGNENKRMFAIHYLNGNHRALSGNSPGSTSEVTAHVRAVQKICAKPEHRSVTKDTCGGDTWSPSLWCDVGNRADELLAKGAEDEVGRLIGRFKNATFYARAVANSDGWRDVHSWKDMFFAEKDQAQYVKAMEDAYKERGLTKTVDTAKSLKPIFDAFKATRADADAKAPTWTTPKSAGKDYSSALAKKQLKKFTVKSKFISSFLERDSWKIRKNALGVPLERTKPGFMLYKPKGQTWCQLISYVVTEVYKGGGRYQKAKKVSFGYTRFQKCS